MRRAEGIDEKAADASTEGGQSVGRFVYWSVGRFVYWSAVGRSLVGCWWIGRSGGYVAVTVVSNGCGFWSGGSLFRFVCVCVFFFVVSFLFVVLFWMKDERRFIFFVVCCANGGWPRI